MWAQATLGGDNVFARLVKTGKKVLRKVLHKQFEPAVGKEIPKPTWSLRAQTVQVSETSSRRLIGGFFPKRALQTQALIRDSRKVPVFAFVGLSLGASLDQKKGETDDVLCSGIRVCHSRLLMLLSFRRVIQFSDWLLWDFSEYSVSGLLSSLLVLLLGSFTSTSSSSSSTSTIAVSVISSTKECRMLPNPCTVCAFKSSNSQS